MMRKVLLAGVAGLVLAAGAAPVVHAQAGGSASRPAASAAWQDGLFDVRLDREKGRVLARLSAPDAVGVIGRNLYQPG